MASEEKLQEFIAQTKALTTLKAFQGVHPYPFLVNESTRVATKPREDRATIKMSRSAAAPIGDGFGFDAEVSFHRVFPRSSDDPAAAVTIGRDAGCDLVIDDGSVSGVHARFSLEVGPDDQMRFYVADAGSSNGTFVNGERLGRAPQELENMDSVRLGPAVKLQFFTAEGFFEFLSLYRRIKKG